MRLRLLIYPSWGRYRVVKPNGRSYIYAETLSLYEIVRMKEFCHSLLADGLYPLVYVFVREICDNGNRFGVHPFNNGYII